jgi:molybdenum cofactor cytidylyltransferase
VFAVVPAAGRSRRMGAPKQIQPVGQGTLLDAVLKPLTPEVAGTIVVTYSEIAEQLELGRFPHTHLAMNDNPRSEMIDSIRIGLGQWRARERIAENDGFLVCPGDHPGIAAEDFRRCVAAFRSDSGRIVIAARGGQRGHPIIFPTSLAPFVESPACDGGLHALPNAHPQMVQLVICESVGITRDVDTPEDYERLH